jgi:hypothetical protein
MDELAGSRWLYLAACVVVPAAWGALSAWLFSRRDRRARADAPPAPGRPDPHIDYMI